MRRRPRPHQAAADGQAAAELSDFVVLTSDNPRSEDPLAIMNDALVGSAAWTSRWWWSRTGPPPSRARSMRRAKATW